MILPGLKRILNASLYLIFIFLPINEDDLFLRTHQSASEYSSSMDLINAVNSLRISNGLPAYQINQTLMIVAQNHSDYQASIGTTTHYGPDGSRPFQRALSAGYSVAGDLSLGGYFSENIVAGRNLTAADAIISWKSDAPHLNTMLSTTLQDIGAGVTVIGETVYYTIDVGLSSSGKPIATLEPGILPTFNPYSGKKILTSTPENDGSIYHIVNFGDTIWSISQAYKIPEEELIQLNSLPDNFIYVGDKFIIRPAYTPTPTTPTSTPTIISTQTLSPSSTSILETSSFTSSPTTTDIFPKNNREDKILIAIIIFTLVLAGLFVLFGNRRAN